MLSFLENPMWELLDPLTFMQMLSDTTGTAIQLLNKLLLINVQGQDYFLGPRKDYPTHMLDSNIVLGALITAAQAQALPSTALMLPPADSDEQHLQKWRRTADYAAKAMAMVAGIVGLDTGYQSPLLGGWQGDECIEKRCVSSPCYSA
jgi:hypothetical protein